jgi:hypothetical protein
MTGWTNDSDLIRCEVRLLHDVVVLDRVLDDDRVPARERLAQELGAGFADALRSSLLGTTTAKAA